MSDTYRLYIDETGTPSPPNAGSIAQKYFFLLGTIISRSHLEQFILPNWDNLRNLLTVDPDYPTIVHLPKLRKGKHRLKLLDDPNLNSKFEQQLIDFLENAEISICCILLNKEAVSNQYHKPYDSYHYALKLLLERYVLYLEKCSGTGDVIAEARGKKENALVKLEFEKIYRDGTEFLSPTRMQNRLSHGEVGIEKKEARVRGLEISDILAAPLKYWVLNRTGLENVEPTGLNKKIAEVARKKLMKDSRGKTNGYGIKIFPELPSQTSATHQPPPASSGTAA